MQEINWEKIRTDFPILQTMRNGKSLVYLDNSATSQKPQVVLDSIQRLYQEYNANIHRGVYHLSEYTSELYEKSKHIVASFINAPSYETIVYTKSTTESINTIAYLLEKEIKEHDEIVISIMEHHSNLLPWQQLAKRTGAILKYIPVNEKGDLEMANILNLITEKTKVIALSHVSNVLGTINPIKEICDLIKGRNVYTVIDGAQAVGQIPVDVMDLDCDFYVFSGHKMLAPTGIGVLYAKKEFLVSHDPLFFGGDMIEHVERYTFTYNTLPWKYEAGTNNYEGGIALGVACEYIQDIGIDAIMQRKKTLLSLLTCELQEILGIRIYGTSEQKVAIVSFTLDNIHPHDIATLLDEENICIRAGNHCAEPLVHALGSNALARVSLQFYNNEEDIERFIKKLTHIKTLFHG